MNKNIDARGMACPLPVINTKKELESMAAGESVEVLVDNDIAVQNLCKFAAQRKYTSASEKIDTDNFKVIITKTDNKDIVKDNAESDESKIQCKPDVRAKGQLVVLSANTMGSGNNELGKALMKAFVFALTKQDILPQTVIMYNSGAYLSCEGSDSLEDLKLLEAQGVEILTCGTCLNFYELSEKLAVGDVTNMYDIVERMEKADKIIRP